MNLESCLQRQDIWRGTKTEKSESVIATGFATLDHCLPSGGWPRGALTEILVENLIHSPLWLILPALHKIMTCRAWQVWISPPALPYPPGLDQNGLRLSKMLLVDAQSHADLLWSTEQSLRSRACSAVICWPGKLNRAGMRRLQLAAEYGDTWGICFQDYSARDNHSMAALRIQCRETADGMKIDFLKCRGGPLHQDIPVARRLGDSPDHAMGQ